ncbi:protein neuralized-like isoform X2 [Amphibalanus amphitrite]|uniref:protein neuralized-like isoform X2 n=1 Tax=Amphibalanus amphitrite TaxID=1232801 RepID=UPI001C8FD702|nr:protein neuralized-like isoform X2 [Amphibalanus amphitrite]
MKLKALKKLRNIGGGLASSTNNSNRYQATNNLPPLLFHPCHGENIRLMNGGARAQRVDSYCKGIVFSSRPVRINEKIMLRLADVSNQWSGVVRLGFTSVDPRTHTHGLPKYACPDLTSKPGFWAKAMSERYAEPGCVFFYYVTAGGDVHFGLNNEEKGIFFSGVDVSRPLWCLVDIYGNATALEIVQPQPAPLPVLRPTNEELERWTRPALAALTINAPPPHAQQPPLPLPAPQPQPPALAVKYHTHCVFSPLLLHPRVRGRNVTVSPDRTVAARLEGEFCNGYVFGQRPLRLGERLVVQVLSRCSLYVGGLAFGLTSCDPSRLTPAELPDDADLLLDRPEYWVLAKDVARTPAPGDELSFKINGTGAVEFSRNGGAAQVLMHVDASLDLWPVLDVFGGTGRIRVLGVTSELTPGCAAPPPVRAGSEHSLPVPARPSQPLPPPPAELQPAAAADCAVCFERASDAALYSCGHVCMCYCCAVQWKARGGAVCPICRAPIRDVIRLYRS